MDWLFSNDGKEDKLKENAMSHIPDVKTEELEKALKKIQNLTADHISVQDLVKISKKFNTTNGMHEINDVLKSFKTETKEKVTGKDVLRAFLENDTTNEHKKGTLHNKNGTAKHAKSTLHHKNGTSQHAKSTLHHKNGTAQHAKSTLHHKNGTSQHAKSTLHHKNGTAQHAKSTLHHKNGTSQHAKSTLHHKNETSHHKNGTAQHATSTLHHKNGTTQHAKGRLHHKNATTQHKNITSEKSSSGSIDLKNVLGNLFKSSSENPKVSICSIQK